MKPAVIKLENKIAALIVISFNGAMPDFRLKHININTLSFAFTKIKCP